MACYAYDYLFEYVSIHVPARGTTEMDLPSARGSSVSIHVPARGTTKNGSAVVSQIMFQSTFPQGERQRKEKKYEHTDSFNPRSRKGNDVPTIPKVKNPTVSIHVPARGTTASAQNHTDAVPVSIHVPARGTTKEMSKYTTTLKVSIHVPARGTT